MAKGSSRNTPNPSGKLPEQFAAVGLSGGLDSKTDYKLVNAPNTLQATNVRYGTSGSVRKRLGTTGISALSNVVTAFTTQTELIACDSSNMNAIDPVANTATVRGPIGAASVVAKSIVALGNTFGKTLRTISVDYLTVGGINYGLVAWDYATNMDLAYNVMPNGNMDVGGTVNYALFNATTGARIWSSSTIGITNTSLNYKMMGSASTTPTLTVGTSIGAAYPIVVGFNGVFYLSFVSVSVSSKVVDSTTTINGNMYAQTTFQITPSTTAAPIGPTAVGPGVTAVTPTPYLIGGSPTSPPNINSTFGVSFPIPMYSDMKSNGTDIVIYCTGRNYSAPSGGGTPYTAVSYLSTSGYLLFSNSGVVPFNVNAGPSTPNQPQNVCSIISAPGTPFYAVATLYSATVQIFQTSYTATPTAAFGGYVLGTAGGYTGGLTYPFSGTFGNSNQAMYVSDGIITLTYVVTPSNPTGFSPGLFLQTPTMPDWSSAPIAGTNGYLASRVFMFNGFPYAWTNQASFNRSLTNDVALLNLIQTPNPASAHAGYLRAGTLGVSPDPQTTPNLNAPFTFPRQACGAYTMNASAISTAIYSITNSAESVASISTLAITMDTVGTPRNVVPAPKGVLYLGADPKYYDGSTCTTMGWLKVPEVQNNVATYTGVVLASALPGYARSKGSGLFPGGTYTYFYVYVAYDASGNTIYSSPSAALQFTVPSAAGKYVFFIPAASIPTRGFLQVYRNTVSQPNVYVKVQQISSADVIAAGGAYGNGFIDDNGNAAAVENLSGGLLYAPPSGGELANDPPPASTLGAANKQRIFLVSQENPTWVYFSKPFFPGRAPEFNSGQFIDIDPTTGPITGIAALDTVVVIFKQNNIYSFSGSGPDATGAGSFTDVLQIATDAGCIDAPSVLVAQDGVWFRSRRGLQMLSRAGQVTYPGLAVETLLTGTTVVESALVPAQNQYRFSLSNGNVLVYDYLTQAWSVCIYFRPGSAVASPPTSLALLNGTVYSANQAGDLCVESATTFKDGTNNIPITVQSAWIPVAGPQGWGRIRRVAALGDFRSAHTLTMSFSYDYNATPAYNIPYTASTATQQNPYNWRVRAPRQVCQAIQITLTDNAPAGEGAILTGLVLELGPKSQALRVPDTQSV